MKTISVTCECKGTGFIAVADNGGGGVEYVAVLIEKAAYDAGPNCSAAGCPNPKGSDLAEWPVT
jgi:hypothetical protein